MSHDILTDGSRSCHFKHKTGSFLCLNYVIGDSGRNAVYERVLCVFTFLFDKRKRAVVVIDFYDRFFVKPIDLAVTALPYHFTACKRHLPQSLLHIEQLCKSGCLEYIIHIA